MSVNQFYVPPEQLGYAALRASVSELADQLPITHFFFVCVLNSHGTGKDVLGILRTSALSNRVIGGGVPTSPQIGAWRST